MPLRCLCIGQFCQSVYHELYHFCQRLSVCLSFFFTFLHPLSAVSSLLSFSVHLYVYHLSSSSVRRLIFAVLFCPSVCLSLFVILCPSSHLCCLVLSICMFITFLHPLSVVSSLSSSVHLQIVELFIGLCEGKMPYPEFHI